MKILVTGDRKWDDEFIVRAALVAFAEQAASEDDEFIVIEGGAKGADEHARKWARFWEDTTSVTIMAEWDKYGLAAGPIRNQRMIDEEEPDYVLAFHDDLSSSKGTRICVQYAKAKGIPVYLISRP